MMMKAAFVACLAALVAGGPAAAGVPAVFKAPPAPAGPSATMAPATAVSTAPGAASQTPPKGIPGFFDPATQTFTPLQTEQPAGSASDGILSVVILFSFFPANASKGTINTVFLNEFGHSQSNPAAQSSAAATSSFVVSQSDTTYASFPTTGRNFSQKISAPFTTIYPIALIKVSCGYATSTVSYYTTIFLSQQAPKSGTSKMSATCYL